MHGGGGHVGQGGAAGGGAVAIRSRRRARQREGRIGQVDDRNACRGRADEGRPARRHHRPRLAPARPPPPSPPPPRGGFSPFHIKIRRSWAGRAGLRLELPVHFRVTRGESLKIEENETVEFAGFANAITSVEHTHDFVVIDTPGADTYLTRLAHSMADTLITPLNDSFIDFDVLGKVDPETFALTGTSHYSEMVREARRQRRIVDGRHTDWVVVRNRLSALGARNKRRVGDGITQLAARLGFRFIDGCAERVVYRELFPRGLTALDPIDEATLGARPSMAHVTAREEVQGLLAALRL